MKCQYSSRLLNARLRTERIKCYFAHLACSTGGKERFLVVNERDIGMTYNEMQGGNFFFGGTHFLLLASLRPIDGPFKPVILKYSGSEIDKINYIAQISDNAVCTTKGNGSQYYASGLVTQKSISNYRMGTAVPQNFIGMKMPSDSMVEPSVTAVDMFELYIDAKIREIMTNSYLRYGRGFTIIDIGGKYAHDLPCVGFGYEYVNVNVTRDDKTVESQLDIIYDTRISFARNMNLIIAATERKFGAKPHKMILCRNFLFALNLSIAELNETCRQANTWTPPVGCSYYANWFGVRNNIEEHLPTYVCSKFSLYRPNYRYKGRVLIFHTYPSYNVLCNTVGIEEDRLIADRIHLYAVFFQKGTYIERPDYINAQLLLNLYQCRTLVN